jgi:uncharacterized protein YeaO (DUF488 family)
MLGNIKSYVGDNILQIYTAQIKYTNLYEIKQNKDTLDVTIKSGKDIKSLKAPDEIAGKVFAPSWGMVMGHKNLRLTDEQYTQMYYKLMRQNYKNNREEWEKLLAREKVVLLCYCYSGAFCHRYLLKDMLVKAGAEYKGEIEI